MAKSVKILDEAETEAHIAWKWYAERSERAGARFQQELEKAVASIQEQPDCWPTYVHDTHYFKLKKFPYLIVYRETMSEIHIIAVAHGRQRKGYWKRRVSR